MKKTTFGIIIILLTFSACKKDNNPGGWWNFKGSYNVVSNCRQDYFNLVASDTLVYNMIKYPNVLEVSFYQLCSTNKCKKIGVSDPNLVNSSILQ